MLEIWWLTIFQRSYEINAVFNTIFILWITHCHAWTMSRLRGFCCPLSKWLSLWANIAKSKDLTTSVGLRPKWIWVLQKLYPITSYSFTSYPITYIQELSQVFNTFVFIAPIRFKNCLLTPVVEAWMLWHLVKGVPKKTHQ